MDILDVITMLKTVTDAPEGHVSDLVRVSPEEFVTLTAELTERLRHAKDFPQFWDDHVHKHRRHKFYAARVFIATLLMVQVGAIMKPEVGK
jgi:hypothetical protein